MKLVRYLISTLLILLIGLGVYFWVMRLSIVTRMLSYNLSSDVEISGVKVSLRSTTIEGVKIKNPKRSAVNDALEIDKVVVTCFPLEFFKKHIYIDRLSIQSPKIRLEYYDEVGIENNWALLLTHMTPAENPKTVTVKHLELLNVRFWATDSEGKKLDLWPIPYIEFDRVGHSKGVTLPQLTRILFQTILAKLVKDKRIPEKTLTTLGPLPPELIKGVESTLTSDEFRSPND